MRAGNTPTTRRLCTRCMKNTGKCRAAREGAFLPPHWKRNAWWSPRSRRSWRDGGSPETKWGSVTRRKRKSKACESAAAQWPQTALWCDLPSSVFPDLPARDASNELDEGSDCDKSDQKHIGGHTRVAVCGKSLLTIRLFSLNAPQKLKTLLRVPFVLKILLIT